MAPIQEGDHVVADVARPVRDRGADADEPHRSGDDPAAEREGDQERDERAENEPRVHLSLHRSAGVRAAMIARPGAWKVRTSVRNGR
jgi:hypothetical protein